MDKLRGRCHECVDGGASETSASKTEIVTGLLPESSLNETYGCNGQPPSDGFRLDEWGDLTNGPTTVPSDHPGTYVFSRCDEALSQRSV